MFNSKYWILAQYIVDFNLKSSQTTAPVSHARESPWSHFPMLMSPHAHVSPCSCVIILICPTRMCRYASVSSC